MSDKFEYKPSYGGTEEVEVTLDFYVDNNNLYLGMESYDNELKSMDHYGDITVNIIDMPYLYSAIDTNNNDENIVSFLEENGFGHDTGRVVSSGYCIYPIFKFNEETLNRIAPFEFQEYQKAHGIQPQDMGIQAQEQAKPLADLIQEAREKAAERNNDRPDPTEPDKTRKSPEVDR